MHKWKNNSRRDKVDALLPTIFCSSNSIEKTVKDLGINMLDDSSRSSRLSDILPIFSRKVVNYYDLPQDSRLGISENLNKFRKVSKQHGIILVLS